MSVVEPTFPTFRDIEQIRYVTEWPKFLFFSCGQLESMGLPGSQDPGIYRSGGVEILNWEITNTVASTSWVYGVCLFRFTHMPEGYAYTVQYKRRDLGYGDWGPETFDDVAICGLVSVTAKTTWICKDVDYVSR